MLKFLPDLPHEREDWQDKTSEENVPCPLCNTLSSISASKQNLFSPKRAGGAALATFAPSDRFS